MPSLNFQEVKEIGMYEALLEDARTINPNDEKAVDDLLERIELEYARGIGLISDEMVRYITGILCNRS